jgi:NAD(P)-dependent dehydrogenase (short-subunit alcohol dehydrogenase family)
MKPWTLEDVKSQEGKTFLITGGSSGIGYEAALELARKGARVIIASDDPEKGIAAVKAIADEVTEADIGFESLNLSDLESVRIFAFRMRSMLPSLDALILNAGISGVSKRMESPDGNELIFATNYLGHFALTALLFPLLLEVPDSRIIGLGSVDHKHAHIHFDDLQMKKKYNATEAYARSKLALMLFTFELQRQIEERGLMVKSLSVHPGAAKTSIFDRGPEIAGQYLKLENIMKRFSIKSFGQTASKGALPIIFAATARNVKGGAYYGPQGLGELWGSHPDKAELAVQAENMTVARRLWQESLRLTKVEFDFGGQGLSRHH